MWSLVSRRPRSWSFAPLLAGRSRADWSPVVLLVAALLVAGLAGGRAAAAQDAYDPSWYDAEAPHVKIGVAQDGVYRVRGADLTASLPPGVTLGSIDPSTLRLLERGREVPLDLEGMADGSFDADDAVVFVGRRNRGDDEAWAYGDTGGDASAQPSTFYSLYTDTTTYWLTWGGAAGRRYDVSTASPSLTGGVATARDTLRLEREERYYLGGTQTVSQDPRYLGFEGYYYQDGFSRSPGDPGFTRSYTLPVGATRAESGSMVLRVRVQGASASCHRMSLEADLTGGRTQLDVAEWGRYDEQILAATVEQAQIPSDGLTMYLVFENSGFPPFGCGTLSATNVVYVDWIEADYVRRLTTDPATGDADALRFAAAPAAEATFALRGFTSPSVRVYSPRDARRYDAAISGGTARFADDPTGPATYWAVGTGSLRAPASIEADVPSFWADAASQGADYVALTTALLRPVAQELATYRAARDGMTTVVVNVEDVFDEFDYGRPTPIAIRRFVRATQGWSGGAPRFLSIVGDAQQPYVDRFVDDPSPPWSVPSFGFPPSDAWFAMQTEGANDWAESVAVGRLPIRTVEQGRAFLDKLRTYEDAPLDRWQKRTLLMAGGTSTTEQNTLQSFSNFWGQQMLDPVGADTIRYYKRADDALDPTFQDSLTLDLQRGATWLNYFGHSGAQQWEIVTDAPEDFGNAGRLPFVVSLGCRTGSFARASTEVLNGPSLGERLVTGWVQEDGSLVEGAANGAIAHWGTSALGTINDSAILNNELIDQVFLDTVRVAGVALQQAKGRVAEGGLTSSLVRHLLAYNLIGEPALRLALPAQPDLYLDAAALRLDPASPTPSDSLRVTVALQNRGLVPADSVDLRLTHERPDGTAAVVARRLPPFARDTEAQARFFLREVDAGLNTVRAEADPDGRLPEVSDANNVAVRTPTVFSSGVELLCPSARAVVTSTTPTLRLNLFQPDAAAASRIAVEIDTTARFDSPVLASEEIGGTGIVLGWTPPGTLVDGWTYAWRARVINPNGTPGPWRTGSFVVRSDLAPEAGGDVGGTRTAFAQQGTLYDANDGDRLSYENGTWAFATYPASVTAQSHKGGSGASAYGFNINGVENYEYFELGFGVLVLDGEGGTYKNSRSFTTYDVADQFLDEFGELDEAIANLRAFLDAEAEAGDYVFVRTRHLARQSSPTIQEAVRETFRNLGSSPSATPYSTAIDTISYNNMWVMRARKGFPEQTVELVTPASDPNNVLTLESDLRFAFPEGTTTSPVVGPASAWGTLRWQATGASDDASVTLEVLSADGTTVLASAPSGLTGTADVGALVDAGAHPTVRLRATLTDSTAFVAPQLQRWSLSYDGTPELALDPAALQAVPDTLAEGAGLPVAVPVANLGRTASAAPPVVTYTVTDAGNTTVVAARDTLDAPLAPDATATSTVELSTAGRVGRNQLSVSVGTTDPAYDPAAECIAFNNAAVRTFDVTGDTDPPVLSVIVDGRELPPTPPDVIDSAVTNLDDETLPFVSQQPTIEIVLADDNPYFPIDDPDLVEVRFGAQTDLVGEPPLLSIEGNDDLEFVPGSTDNNQARLVFTPDLTDPQYRGEPDPATGLYPTEIDAYRLKVEATDASGNPIDEFGLLLRAKDNQEVFQTFPYPNPMSTHTTFAFEVEGGSGADLRDFRLRIYTVSGRLVREFDTGDVDGGLRVGWNRVRWDGRDEDGDRVATGVYLYRVSVTSENGTFEGDVEKVAVIR